MADEDQPPEGRLFLDDARVVLDVGRSRHAVDERGDVGGAADFVELAGAAQLFFERDEIDRVAALGELDHLVEDAPVRVAEEIARVDHFGGEIEGVVVQQDRAEHGSLGLEIVRQRAFGDGEFGHAIESGRGGRECSRQKLRARAQDARLNSGDRPTSIAHLEP